MSAAPTVRPSPGRSCSDVGGHAGRVQQLHGGAADQRRLLGRLGDHRVAGGERRADLAGEDRERKIPRADAGENAARRAAQAIALAGRAGQQRSRPNCAAPAARSSAGNPPPRAPRRRVGQASCPPRARARHELVARSASNRSAARSQDRRARLGAARFPGAGAALAARHGALDVGGGRLRHRADRLRFGRAGFTSTWRVPLPGLAVDERACAPGAMPRPSRRRSERVKVPPRPRNSTPAELRRSLPNTFRRQRDARMRPPRASYRPRDRIGDHVFDRQRAHRRGG